MEDNIPNRNIKHILSLKGHKGSLNSGRVNIIAIFPDKKHFVSGGSDNFIKLWDIDNLREVRRWIQESENYVGEVRTLVIVDNNQFLSGGHDEEVKLWDKRRNEPLKRFYTGSTIAQIALSLDKKFFITRDMHLENGMVTYQDYSVKSNGKIQLWDLESGTRIATPDATKFTSVTFFPSKPPFLLSILGEIVLGRQDGHIEYWQIKKTDTSVELKKKTETKTPIQLLPDHRHRVIDTIIYTSYNEYVLGKFIARVNDGNRYIIVKFEVYNSKININTEKYWKETESLFTHPSRGLGLVICSDNNHILLQDGFSLCVWDSVAHISDYKPIKRISFNVDPNVDKVSSISKGSRAENLNTIAILNNDMIFTGWNDGKIKIWSSRNYPLGRSNSSWFDRTVSYFPFKHIEGYAGLKEGDQYKETIEEEKKSRGGMKKSKRVYKRSNRIVNKTRGRKK